MLFSWLDQNSYNFLSVECCYIAPHNYYLCLCVVFRFLHVSPLSWIKFSYIFLLALHGSMLHRVHYQSLAATGNQKEFFQLANTFKSQAFLTCWKKKSFRWSHLQFANIFLFLVKLKKKNQHRLLMISALRWNLSHTLSMSPFSSFFPALLWLTAGQQQKAINKSLAIGHNCCCTLLLDNWGQKSTTSEDSECRRDFANLHQSRSLWSCLWQLLSYLPYGLLMKRNQSFCRPRPDAVAEK